MSHSKFESLSNEILMELFEKYMNGSDLIIAFAFQRNDRLKQLIAACKPSRFDFTQCNKDDFQECMHYIPVYLGGIEKLALSDHQAPGQIYDFLRIFPSFRSFTKLRRLYFCANTEAYEEKSIDQALQSLRYTNVKTLVLKVKRNGSRNGWRSARPNDNDNPPNLRNLCIAEQMDGFVSNNLANLQQLILTNHYYSFDEFHSILQNAPDLKYLAIQLSRVFIRLRQSKISQRLLHTLILQIDHFETREFSLIEEYLSAMPNLRRLEVTSDENILAATAWENLITQSLPALTHLILHSTMQSWQERRVAELLAPFEESFWKEKNNFRIIISQLCQNDSFSHLRNIQVLSQSFLDRPVQRCYIRPIRHGTKSQNPFRALYISPYCGPFVPCQNFDQLISLAFNRIDDNFYSTIRGNINGSQIQHLVISSKKCKRNSIVSLLPHFPNLRSLSISFYPLFSDTNDDISVNENLRHLDLSIQEHDFREEEMLRIKRLFPNLEHLSTCPREFNHIPKLKTHLPRLSSLRFWISQSGNREGVNTDCDMYDRLRSLARRANCYCRLDTDGLMIWLARDLFREEHWKTYTEQQLSVPNRKISKQCTDDDWADNDDYANDDRYADDDNNY